MRTAFAEALCCAAELDERIWLLTGDLGYSVLDAYAARFPGRFLNVGVAEQNLAGVAAGLAHTGKIVFIYSIANFPTFRCLEQIRNDICYHELPVRIVAVGAGFAYGSAGYSHHALEDLAVMRSLPGMTVLAPADPTEATLLTRALIEHPGPAYLRLGKAGEPRVHRALEAIQIGRALTVCEGADLTLIALGSMVYRAREVVERLKHEHGLLVRLISMHTLKPLDVAAIERAARETPCIITVEEHSITGGLGTAVAEVLAEMGSGRARLCRYGVPDRLLDRIGSQSYLLEACGNLEQAVLSLAHSVATGASMTTL